MKLKESAFSKTQKLRKQIKQKGYYAGQIDGKQYNFEFVVKKNAEKLKVQIYFGKKGLKTVLQGNTQTELHTNIYQIVFSQENFDFQIKEVDEPSIYIGSDESGKGDVFGPLVVAAFYSDQNSRNLLLNMGVRDSKELSDSEIATLAEVIIKKFPNDFEILILDPIQYNQLYDKFRNLNSLLSWAHSEVISKLLIRNPSTNVIIDKFGNRSISFDKNINGEYVEVVQTTKAERYTGVAAASILARQKMVKWFESSETYLPKGASEDVDIAVNRIVHANKSDFKKIAKLHFKNVKKALDNIQMERQ